MSIDKTPRTKSSGKQTVRFEGGIARTEFGRQFLLADVTLKRLALGQLSAEMLGIRSYFDLSADHAKNRGIDENVGTRFWFYAIEPALAVRDGVFVIEDLRIGVCTQVLSASVGGKPVANPAAANDEVADAFASAMTARYADLAVHYPEIGRLKTLLDLVALARGIQSLPVGRNVEYWLRGYQVPEVQTMEEFPLLKREGNVQTSAGVRTMEIDGGVQLKALLVRLREGDPTALREAVLASRPGAGALTWKVPLHGWAIPGSPEGEVDDRLPGQSDFGHKLGCFINRTIGRPAATPFETALDTRPFRSTMPEFRINNSLPAQRFSDRVGGVMLHGVAGVEGGSARVDVTGGQFSLVVDGKNARIDPQTYRKFITALWCVYYGSQDPGISIDPIAPDVKKHVVRYIGNVINTDLGRVLREADYVMKKWAVGTERPDVEGFECVDDLSATYGMAAIGVSRRFWFIPEDLRFNRGGDLLLFAGGRMRLKTEYNTPAGRGQSSRADEAFAGNFTDRYAAIAGKHPVYRELFEYAQMVALAKYLKQQGVPLHWFIIANKDLVLTEDSPGTVDELARGSRHREGVTIMGGVNLGVEGNYVFDSQAVAAVNQALAQRRAGAGPAASGRAAAGVPAAGPERTSFELGQQSYSIVPQHTLTSGRDARGLHYQTDLALRRNGEPGLELVRYYNPRNRDAGQFGAGWHLLVPYRVRPEGNQKREIGGAIVPARMAVENLTSGEREVLTFSTDRYSIAGYVPEDVKTSRLVGLFLMSDASFRLADKLGNEFHFDGAGRMDEMAMSWRGQHRVQIAYADLVTDRFEQAPYAAEPTDREKVQVLNVLVPRRVTVTDLVHGTREELTFNKDGEKFGYFPDSASTSRFRTAALLTNGGLQLEDRHGNTITLDPAWKFRALRPDFRAGLVQSVAMADQTARFRWTIDGTGRVVVASAELTMGKDASQPSQIVRYHYADDGRLARVTRSDPTHPRRVPLAGCQPVPSAAS